MKMQPKETKSNRFTLKRNVKWSGFVEFVRAQQWRSHRRKKRRRRRKNIKREKPPNAKTKGKCNRLKIDSNLVNLTCTLTEKSTISHTKWKISKPSNTHIHTMAFDYIWLLRILHFSTPYLSCVSVQSVVQQKKKKQQPKKTNKKKRQCMGFCVRFGRFGVLRSIVDGDGT